MRKFIAVLALILWGGTVQAQELKSANYMFKYDLDSTTMTFCRLEGTKGDPFGPGNVGLAPINISSANGNVAATTAGTNPFLGLAAKDVINVVYKDGTTDTKVIITFTDNDTIVVDSAFTTTVTAQSFNWYKTRCGTTDADGWIDVSAYAYKAITFEIEQVNVTGGLDVRWDCKDPDIGGNPVQVFPSCTVGACNTVQNYSGVAGITSRTKLVINEPSGSCRIGVAIHTGDDGNDLTTNTEQLTAILTVQLQR